MLNELNLERPLAVLDLETTGISPRADRIVEIAAVRITPDGKHQIYRRRVNPGIPIPAEATRIHGISDGDVADCPAFADIAEEVYAFLATCDLAGYNVARFDVPMLIEEFIRAGIDFDADERRVVDVQTIFHKHEPRDLTAALAYYCGELHVDAHGAEADTLATARVLEGQLGKYPDLPREVAALDQYCNPRDPDWVDRQGRLKWRDGEIVLNFGRKKGTLLRELVDNDPNFVKWMLRSDFPKDTRRVVSDAAQGRWPSPPGKGRAG